MARETRTRVAAAVWRRRGRPRRRDERPDAATALAALARAWTTTVIASALFLAAAGVARVWDGAVYRQALAATLNSQEEFQPMAGDEHAYGAVLKITP